MKVGLTVWENRISPVFDAANILLIAEIRDKKVISKRLEPFDAELPSRMANRLNELNITVLICGAISEVPANIIEASKIKLVPFISGKADDVLECYAQGIQIIPSFLMPGCGRRRRRQGIGKNICFAQKREVSIMPRGDGTGPQGQGAGTGRGQGGCKAGKGGRGTGQGKGRGGGQGKGSGGGQGKGRSGGGRR